MPGKDWRRFRGRFRTGPKAERIELQFILWTFLDAPKTFCNDLFKPGDCVLIDNLSVVKDDRFAEIQAMIRNAREPFRVAPYAVEADASCPFMPYEMLDPPEKIVFRAAVNEKKPLPVAVANLTDSFAQYRVVLEAVSAASAGKRGLADLRDAGIQQRMRERGTL